jgi:uncharacterized membrane protein YgcG
MSDQTDTNRPSESVSPFGDISRINGEVAEGFARASQIYTRAFADFQAELTKFINSRMQQDGEFARCISNCDNWTEATRLQQDWAMNTVQDYLNEANEMARLGARLTTGTLSAFQAVTEPMEMAAGDRQSGSDGGGQSSGGRGGSSGSKSGGSTSGESAKK